jgi:hypothetical protein
MTIRASRGARLLAAAALAWLGLALSAQAAHATYSKVQIVKINQGGNQADVFTFDTHLTPSPNPAWFTLKGGDTSGKIGVECNASAACTNQWGQLTQTITERAASGYTLTGIVCRHTQGNGSWPAEPDGNSPIDSDTTFDLAARKITFKLAWWEWVKCYVTNTRDTGTVNVTKKVVAPAGDTGRFNLLVDGAVKKADAGDGGTTGDVTVDTGSHTVGESAGTGTSLGDYTASTACVDTAHPQDPVDTDGSLQVDKGDHWACTITNTRKTQPPPPAEPPSDTPPANPPASQTAATPQIEVSPARVRPGSAKLRGPSGCPTTNAVAATVTGRRIVKVTFYVDGRKVKTLTKANASGGRWVLPLNMRRLGFGTHRVRVTVQFAKSSATKAKTLRLSFNRCQAAAVRPQFTG